LDQRVRVAVENHARGGLDRALNPRRDLRRLSQSGGDGQTQCNEEYDAEDGTQQIHAGLIGRAAVIGRCKRGREGY
jgi:hypothetical protein